VFSDYLRHSLSIILIVIVASALILPLLFPY